LTPPEKSGSVMKKKTRTPIGLLIDTKRYWVVLTSGFLHFFHSAQDSAPQKSISLDEILVNVANDDSDTSLGYCFTITYYRKDHTLYSQTRDEVVAWANAIKSTKEKYAKMATTKVGEKLRPIEIRIRNHIMGLKLAYDVSLSTFETTKDSKIVRVFS
jgi:hypothetical protein